MLAPMPEISLEEIIADIQAARSTDEEVVLFLGSRAGRLFGNVKLYDRLKPFGFQSFNNLPTDSAKFSECYRILADSKHFNEKDIYDILSFALKDTVVSTDRVVEKEDRLLAELLQGGFFDAIVSADVDNVLQSTFSDMSKEAEQNFNIYSPPFGVTEDGSIKNLLEHDIQFPALVKIFGDLKARRYKTVYDNIHFESEPELAQRLKDLLSVHLLLIGYDPLWDSPLESVFPMEGGHFWYINDESPLEHSQLFQPWLHRGGKWHAGVKTSQKSYRSFINQLYRALTSAADDGRRVTIPLPMDVLGAASSGSKSFVSQEVSVTTTSPLPSDLPTHPTGEKKKTHIFISYSHHDKKYLKELSDHLSPYRDKGLLDFWSDERIEPGAKWYDEIIKALHEAKVAILLVSKHFMNSKFIKEFELPQLLMRAEKDGVAIIPVLVSYCVINHSELKDFQFFNRYDPLAGKRGHTLDRMLVELAELIEEKYQRNKN